MKYIRLEVNQSAKIIKVESRYNLVIYNKDKTYMFSNENARMIARTLIKHNIKLNEVEDLDNTIKKYYYHAKLNPCKNIS